MKTVQIRLTEEQLALIDERVKEGIYPSRSEAIRDYVRRAELFALFNRFFELTEGKPFTGEELERTREKVYQRMIAPKMRRKQALSR